MRLTSSLSAFSRLKRSSNLDDINSILDLLPVAALYVAADSQRVALANTRAAELSAYTRSEMTSLTLADLFIHLELESVLDQHKPAPRPLQLTLVKRNSSLLDVQVNIQEVSPPGRWLLVSIQPVSDVNDRQNEQQRFKQVLEELHSLSAAAHSDNLHSALQMVIDAGHNLTGAPILAVYQADGQHMKLNRIAYRGDILPEQLPSKDLIQLDAAQVWEPGVRPRATLHSLARAAGLAYLATTPIGDPNATVGLLVAGDNQSPPAEDTNSMLQILAGVLQSLIQHYYQVGNLKNNLDTQLRFRRFTQVAQNAIQDILIVSAADFRVIMLNRAAELALGYSDDEAKNMPLKDLLVGPESLQTALKIAQDGIPTLNQENIRLYRRSGEAFQARVSTLPVKDKDRVEGLIILIQDLTEQENVKAQAEQLQQQALLGEVTAIFAHEVRNPINSISMGLQLMAYKLQPDDPQQELISRLQQDLDRLEEMMKSVLAFSRSTEYVLEPVDLGSLVSRLLDRMRPRMSAASVKHHIIVEPNAPLVMGNPLALEQVFTNLFTNAIQAMEKEGGLLAVKVQLSENTGKRKQAQVVVADNGPGIPKEIQEMIFTPFFTTKSSGTGLGLAIAQRIVIAHKGVIQLESIPGATVFNVIIPAMEQNLGNI